MQAPFLSQYVVAIYASVTVLHKRGKTARYGAGYHFWVEGIKRKSTVQ